MPGLSGFSLPPAGPTVGSNFMAAAGQFPQQIQDAKQQKMALQQQELSLQDAKSKQAMQKLSLAYRMMASDPSGQRGMNPDFLKMVTQAAKDAGIQGLTHIDPATGMEVLDSNALKMATSGKLLSDLAPEELKEFGGLLPSQRVPWLERHGVDPSLVSPDQINEIPEQTPKDRDGVTRDFMKQLEAIPSGKQTPEGVAFILRGMKSEIDQAGMSVTDLQDMVTSPEFISQTLAPTVTAKINQLRALGIDETALAKYNNARTKELPLEVKAKIALGQGRLDLDKQKVEQGWSKISQAATRLQQSADKNQTYAKAVEGAIENAAAGRKIDAAKIIAGLQTTAITGLEKERDDLKAVITSSISNNNGDMPTDLLDQLTSLDQNINTRSAQLTQLKATLNGADSKAVSNRTGGKQVNPMPIYEKPSDLPEGAKFIGPGPNGGDLYLFPDGKKREWNG